MLDLFEGVLQEFAQFRADVAGSDFGLGIRVSRRTRPLKLRASPRTNRCKYCGADLPTKRRANRKFCSYHCQLTWDRDAKVWRADQSPLRSKWSRLAERSYRR